MCGRYASSRSREELLEEFEINAADTDGRPVEPDYNVAPTKESPVVLTRSPREDPEGEPVRQLRHFKWGLVPSWAKEPKIGSRMINARAETLAAKPAFRAAVKSRRLIVPISGFYEWFPTRQLGKSGKPLKQPFYMHRRDAHPLALAGLFEFWRDKDKAEDDPDRWLTTFTIITTKATDDVGHIHDRMPMTVAPEHWEAWLDPRNQDVDLAQELMAPPPVGSLDIYPTSTLVNNVRNNGPELLDPLPAEPELS